MAELKPVIVDTNILFSALLSDRSSFGQVILGSQREFYITEDLIDPEHRRRAAELCSDIDPADAPHVALTLHLRGLLWTGDRALKAKLLAKGFDAFFSPDT